MYIWVSGQPIAAKMTKTKNTKIIVFSVLKHMHRVWWVRRKVPRIAHLSCTVAVRRPHSTDYPLQLIFMLPLSPFLFSFCFSHVLFHQDSVQWLLLLSFKRDPFAALVSQWVSHLLQVCLFTRRYKNWVKNRENSCRVPSGIVQRAFSLPTLASLKFMLAQQETSPCLGPQLNLHRKTHQTEYCRRHWFQET